jgi:hypothetical protein
MRDKCVSNNYWTSGVGDELGLETDDAGIKDGVGQVVLDRLLIPVASGTDMIPSPMLPSPAAPSPLPPDDSSPPGPTVDHKALGQWSGSYAYDSGSFTEPTCFDVLQVYQAGTAAAFSGSGGDGYGSFTISGKITQDGRRICFLKEYPSQSGQKVVWWYEGDVSEEGDEISGVWGLPAAGMSVNELLSFPPEIVNDE